ncbi:acyl-CoA thioesterase [Desertibacillus haloalkaliphilus]|uniref:acyl-CoA thioesterase n=1 Tax=Desertibacillus haloalkaliphilus TaxID=1328930 RepID=UPI001C262B0C|nr:thioesterase family protein [Desertibacillus haloalkaliphilus]MBU8906946.1 acyl-CoA thioesterase [Desertibacillus haloalkaliphilus]
MLSDYRFYHPIRVRYSEIDGQKIVFNAHYSTYVDVCATEYFRNVICERWLELAEENIFDLVLKKITIEFFRPARLDDLLHVYCRVTNVGTKSLTCSFVIARDEEVLVTAEAIQVSYNPKEGRSQPIPDEIKEKILQFEGLNQ